MGFTTLGLMLGYGCNARCRSCLWGDAINHGPRMTVEEACAWVDQACALGNLRLVGFSGGEPFLYLSEMKAVARHACKEYGLPSVAATNCFWAVTAEKADATLKSLHDVGMRRLLVSVDDFHQEWVPLDRVRNCLSAAERLEMDCTLQCVVTSSSKKLDFYLEALGVSRGERLSASEIPCTPVGYAATAIPSSEFPIHAGVPKDYCTMLQALNVMPEGTVRLCCGPAFTGDALTAGNLHEERLDAVIERAEWDPIFNALALGNGPCHLAAAWSEEGNSEFLLPGYASSCHACHHILGLPGVAAALRQKMEPQQAELFMKRTIMDQVTSERNADVVNI